jgi:hypothetical protein
MLLTEPCCEAVSVELVEPFCESMSLVLADPFRKTVLTVLADDPLCEMVLPADEDSLRESEPRVLADPGLEADEPSTLLADACCETVFRLLADPCCEVLPEVEVEPCCEVVSEVLGDPCCERVSTLPADPPHVNMMADVDWDILPVEPFSE